MPDGQENPGGQRPGPDPAAPGRIDPAPRSGQRPQRKTPCSGRHSRGKGTADECQSGVLSAAGSDPHRPVAETPAARTGSTSAGKERRNATPIIPCTASTRAFSRSGRLPPNPATAAPIDRQDQHPQQKRPLMVPPDARDLVEHRLQAVCEFPTTTASEKSETTKAQVSAANEAADQQKLQPGRRDPPEPSAADRPSARPKAAAWPAPAPPSAPGSARNAQARRSSQPPNLHPMIGP